ncbi:hypothetical protein GCM10009038_20560 [Salinicola rhizosphaerae]|uniref:DUF1468 domain-containing protein n=2 Tax=Salinicola rhizosphaerae TaxID=1443141 RepID=A0ABQ3E5B5_9GAMM|nr:hypothetical protein GCM10009038_20560 [Salinicola rhizosphaerae]
MVLAVITLIYLISAIRLGPPMRDGNMTASFFPIAIGVVMLLALAAAMAHAIRGSRGVTRAKPAASDDAPAARQYLGLSSGAIGVILLTAGYLLAFDMIGYFVSTFFYVLLLCSLFGGGFTKGLVSRIIAAVVITLAGYLLFEIIFQVRLPTLWSQ